MYSTVQVRDVPKATLQVLAKILREYNCDVIFDDKGLSGKVKHLPRYPKQS